MADLSDVETALASTIAGVLYPNTTAQPSVVGAPCKIRRGWPNAAELDADLLAGTVNVTVFSKTGHTKETTRWQAEWTYSAMTVPTLTATVNAAQTQVTIGGAPGVAQNVGLSTSQGAWAVRAQAADTPATVAAALAALVPGASVSGAVITVPPDPKLIARTGGVGTASQEVRRQHQGFLVSVWAPTQPLRDQVATAVDGALAALSFIPLADGTMGRISYLTTMEYDAPTKDRLWRREMDYLVEYGTLATKNAAQMLFGIEHITASGATSNVYA